MGKGSKRRPRSVTREEEDLRWALVFGKISKREFDKEFIKLKNKGLIKRNGKAIN